MQFYDCEDTQWTLSPVPSHITAWSSDAEPLLPTDAVLGYTAHLDEPNTRKLEELVDAYFYRESENMRRLPKLVVNGGNDEFFLPDDTKVWWRGLPGENHRLMVPNADHGLRFCEPATCTSTDDFTDARNDLFGGTRKFMEATTAFHYAVARDIARPTFDWTIAHGRDGSAIITLVHLSEEPLSVSAWTATSKDGVRRDFRLITCGKANDGICTSEADIDVNPREYVENAVSRGPGGTWSSSCSPPPVGWAAFFLEVRFRPPSEGLAPYRMTTEAIVVPDEYPFADCQSRSCTDSCGTLQLV